MASYGKNHKKNRRHIPGFFYLLVLCLGTLFLLLALLLIPDLREEGSTTASSAEGESDVLISSSEEMDHISAESSISETDFISLSDGSSTEIEETETLSEAASGEEAAVSSETIIETSATSVAAPVSVYENVVFVGDSRTLSMGTGGSLEYALVPDDAIAATWGGQLINDSAFADARRAGSKKKAKAVFWFGINDVQMNPERDNATIFINNYTAVLDAYLEICSSSEIYIVSILTTSVNEKDYYDGQNANIQKYNNALKNLCAEKGYHYLDATALFTGEECFASGDNIHFSKEWYEQSYLPFIRSALGL